MTPPSDQQITSLLVDLQRELAANKQANAKQDEELTKRTGGDYLQQESDRQMEDEIFLLLRNAKYPRAALNHFCRAYGYRPEVGEEIASRVFLERMGKSFDELEYGGMIDKMRLIEERVQDPGMKEWQIQTLAKRYGRSPAQLKEAFTKALINQPALAPQTLAELRLETGDQNWLINGWLIRGTTVLLHADGGTGKTLFSYHLASCLVRGLPWQGYPCQKSKVLLVQLDEPKESTVERLELMGFPDGPDLLIERNWQAEHLPQLAPYIEEHRPDFIVVDSLTAINRNTCFSENDVEYARPILHLADIASRYGCTVLLIHHSSAAGKARGSTAIRNSVSEVWHLKHHNQSLQQMALTVEKTRMGRLPGTYQFDFDPDTFTFKYQGELQGEVVIESNGTQQERIRLWLSEVGQKGTAYHPKEIAEYLNLNDASVRRACHEAWSRDLIKRKRSQDGRGYLYYCPDHLQQTLSPPHPEESETVTSTDQGGTPSDRCAIAARSVGQNLSQQGFEQISDRAIGKNQDFDLLRTSEQRDRPIAKSPQTSQGKEQNCDRAPIAPAIAESTTLLIDNDSDRTLSQASEQFQQKNQSTDCVLAVGDKVRYAGDNWQRQRCCGSKHLTIESVQVANDGTTWATVSHPKLAIQQSYPLSELRRVS